MASSKTGIFEPFRPESGQACSSAVQNYGCLTGRLIGGQVAAFSPNTSRGFSLAESLIAFVVLIVAVLTLTSTYTFAQSRISLRADELQAVTFGQQYLETVRQQVRGGVTSPSTGNTTQPIDAGYAIFSGLGHYSSSSPAPELSSPGNFTATYTLSKIGSTSDWDVRVDVTWPYNAVTQTVTLGTVVTTQAP